MLDRMIRIGALLDRYGPLLTDKQRDICHLHFSEDYSLAEIAEMFGVTRQAVHDALARAEESLIGFETRLGWVGYMDRMTEGIIQARSRVAEAMSLLSQAGSVDQSVRCLDDVQRILAELADDTPAGGEDI